MRLKCIGGPMDGKFWDCHPDSRLRDTVVVRELPKINVVNLENFDPTKIDHVVEKLHYYQIRSIRVADDILKEYVEIKYIAYAELSEFECLRQHFDN